MKLEEYEQILRTGTPSDRALGRTAPLMSAASW